mmetsp:Transcript_41084/g.86309  ORF Transcript_41084/g.86309 Transcript_41084/m.86309 type:complete len:108 (+) Transcript_41084:49-372(+)
MRDSFVPTMTHQLLFSSIIFLAAIEIFISLQMPSFTNPLRHEDIVGSRDKGIENDMQWLDTTGINLTEIRGDPISCRDVIYTADTRLPNGEISIVNASWAALSHIVS